jgi:NADPH:quinone reductase-like Zn-dependent oxidoreductase
LVITGNSGLPQTYPLILGSEISGIVEKVGPDTGDFVAGDEVFGATNPSFISCRSEPLR